PWQPATQHSGMAHLAHGAIRARSFRRLVCLYPLAGKGRATAGSDPTGSTSQSVTRGIIFRHLTQDPVVRTLYDRKAYVNGRAIQCRFIYGSRSNTRAFAGCLIPRGVAAP